MTLLRTPERVVVINGGCVGVTPGCDGRALGRDRAMDGVFETR